MTLSAAVALAASASPAGNQAWQALHAAASAPYRSAGRFAWHFARGKLGRDPVFRALLEIGLIAPSSRVLDIGCGQALLASLLAACDAAARRGHWPAPWAAAPQGCRYHGLELMPRDVARGQRALAALIPAPEIACADMRHAALPACDVVVIFDVLHYVEPRAQADVLARVAQALAPGGRLLLRVGDAAQCRRFAVSQWVDRMVTRLRGHLAAPTWGRPLSEWTQLLCGHGFSVQARPMSRGTPFANVLLVCEKVLPSHNRPTAAAAPAP